jgi:hypothetical protein
MSARDIIALCQKHIVAFGNDCSGFAKAVASDCGVLLAGDANQIVDLIEHDWDCLDDGADARDAAMRGLFVVGGAQAKGHGHVVIVVAGPMSHGHKYPYCFWGSYKSLAILGETVNIGFSRGHGCLNYAFGPGTRDKVIYRSTQPSALIMPRAVGPQGRLIHTFT